MLRDKDRLLYLDKETPRYVRQEITSARTGWLVNEGYSHLVEVCYRVLQKTKELREMEGVLVGLGNNVPHLLYT